MRVATMLMALVALVVAVQAEITQIDEVPSERRLASARKKARRARRRARRKAEEARAAGQSAAFSELACNSGLRESGEWLQWPAGLQKKNGATVVPCGTKVEIKDVKDIDIDGLHVEGWLKVSSELTLETPWVLVEGRFVAGSPSNPVDFPVEIVIKRSNQAINLREVSNERSQAADFGVKAFVVVGGQIAFFGMDQQCPTWARLTETIWPTDKKLVLDDSKVASCWKVGQTIAITSTDLDMEHVEERTIDSIRVVGRTTEITFTTGLEYNHWAETTRYSSSGSNAPEEANIAAEVALVSRNIKIRAETENSAHIGGHLMVHETSSAQNIVGVELINMGQEGNMGRYPIHFHLCLDMASSLVSHNTIRDSNQRGVVVHGTHALQVQWNVALRTKGHVFMLEDGIEQRNVFYRNIGMMGASADRLIPQEGGNSDDHASTFWITNPSNSYIENVAAGCKSGFWFELTGVRGPSLSMPGASSMDTAEMPLGQFHGNVAHSNQVHGLRTYPKGYRPSNGATIQGMLAYKNRVGIFLKNSNAIVFEKATLVDNAIGIDFDVVQACTLKDSLVVGESPNLGNPRRCHISSGGDCRQDGSCALPAVPMVSASMLGQSRLGREVPNGMDGRTATIMGVRFTETDFKVKRMGGNKVTGTRFAGFEPLACRDAAAINLASEDIQGMTDARTQVSNIAVIDNSKLFRFDPTPFQGTAYSRPGGIFPVTRGSAPWQRGFQWDNKFLVSPNDDILDPAKCTERREWGAYECSGICYRNMRLAIDVGSQENTRQFEGIRMHVEWTDSRGNRREVEARPLIEIMSQRPYSVKGVSFPVFLPETSHTYRATFSGSGLGNLRDRWMWAEALEGGCSSRKLDIDLVNDVKVKIGSSEGANLSETN